MSSSSTAVCILRHTSCDLIDKHLVTSSFSLQVPHCTPHLPSPFALSRTAHQDVEGGTSRSGVHLNQTQSICPPPHYLVPYRVQFQWLISQAPQYLGPCSSSLKRARRARPGTSTPVAHLAQTPVDVPHIVLACGVLLSEGGCCTPAGSSLANLQDMSFQRLPHARTHAHTWGTCTHAHTHTRTHTCVCLCLCVCLCARARVRVWCLHHGPYLRLPRCLRLLPRADQVGEMAAAALKGLRFFPQSPVPH